jgi:hypothetical protein
MIAFFEAIILLVMSEEDFDKRYNPGKFVDKSATVSKNDQSATKKCPFCAEEVKIDAVKCKHCGSII